LASVAGWCTGNFLNAMSSLFQINQWVSVFLGIIFLGTPTGVFQWLLLKRHLYRAKWWIVARTVSGGYIFPLTGIALVWLVERSRISDKRKDTDLLKIDI
jgi:hypothetical protein